MARISKTICDRCGKEHVDGSQSEIVIERIWFSIGRPQRTQDIASTGRDLCMDCRDAVVADIQHVVDRKAPHRDERGNITDKIRRNLKGD